MKHTYLLIAALPIVVTPEKFSSPVVQIAIDFLKLEMRGKA